WTQWQHRLGQCQPSLTILKVADNHHIQSMGQWTGKTIVSEVGVEASFKIFDLHRAFEIILGKPWLKTVNAIHDFKNDTIHISTIDKGTTLRN
ncbi:hypothetical protein M422DRAFT_94228, partial [Sphaerobolus stellatus SS14]